MTRITLNKIEVWECPLCHETDVYCENCGEELEDKCQCNGDGIHHCLTRCKK